MTNEKKATETNGAARLEKLREWGKLIVVVTALGAISWTTAQTDIKDNARHIAQMDDCIRELRDELRRVSACGPRGYIDPEIHGATDAHLDHYLRERFGLRGFRRLQDDYSTIAEMDRIEIK